MNTEFEHRGYLTPHEVPFALLPSTQDGGWRIVESCDDFAKIWSAVCIFLLLLLVPCIGLALAVLLYLCYLGQSVRDALLLAPVFLVPALAIVVWARRMAQKYRSHTRIVSEAIRNEPVIELRWLAGSTSLHTHEAPAGSYSVSICKWASRGKSDWYAVVLAWEGGRMLLCVQETIDLCTSYVKKLPPELKKSYVGFGPPLAGRLLMPGGFMGHSR